MLDNLKKINFNILIITNDLYPNLNANSEIAYRLAKALSENYGCKITMMGFLKGLLRKTPSPDYIFKTVRVKPIEIEKEFSKIINPNNEREVGGFTKLKRCLLKPKAFIYYPYLKLHKRNRETDYYKVLKRLIKRNDFDCVIAFCAPRHSINATYKVQLKAPVIFYELDPFLVADFSFIENSKETLIKQAIYNSADAVILTDLIYKDYQKRFINKYGKNKFYVLEFPNLLDYKRADYNGMFDKNKINCVFTGTLYKDIRNPLYTVKLFEEFKQNKNIILHLFGKCSCDEYCLPDKLPENVIYHGNVTSAEALSAMQNADILVNIGNTVLNQLPSKLLTYISLGKPILNIVKGQNCPTLKYMAKYPLGLNILETEEPRAADVTRAAEFIIKNKGEKIPFETIKSLYPDCTIDYVGKKVYNIIEKIVEKKNGTKI